MAHAQRATAPDIAPAAPAPAAAASSTPAPSDASLSELDLRVLEFERTWAARVGAKEAAIRAEFGLPAARYYQLLNALMDSPVALREDPLLVRRLQRVRDARTRARAARSFRPDPMPQDTTE